MVNPALHRDVFLGVHSVLHKFFRHDDSGKVPGDLCFSEYLSLHEWVLSYTFTYTHAFYVRF
jgi:hypothetical protein